MGLTEFGQLLAFLALLCLLFQFVSCFAVFLRKLWRPKGVITDSDQQYVTILRPVSGLENNIERTLESAFKLDHANKEILFCVGRDDDPVLPVIEALRTKYPDVSSQILIGDDPISPNPKLNNLVKGWKAAQYDWIVMTDSNVLMPADYIASLFARWKKDTGLVASPPLGSEPANFDADLEAAFLNSYQARWQLCSDIIGNGFAQGKTLFWRRDVLDKAGGIEALSRELAEDAAATKIVREQGLKVRLSAMPFPQPLGKRDFKSVWSRQARWAKLRRDSFAFFFYLEIISGPVFPLLCLLIAALVSPISFWLIPAFIIIWYAIEFAMTYFVGWTMSARQALAIIARDLMLPILWFSAFGKGGYQWHGHKVDVKKQK